MEGTVEGRAVEVLLREPTYAMPVSALHGALIAELGRGPGSYGELTATLAERRDLFVLMEPTDPLGPAPGWSPELRSEYYDELRAAGFAAELRVALVSPEVTVLDDEPDLPDASDQPDGCEQLHEIAERAARNPLAAVDATLVSLWATQATALPLRDTLAAALSEMEEIRRVLAQDG